MRVVITGKCQLNDIPEMKAFKQLVQVAALHVKGDDKYSYSFKEGLEMGALDLYRENLQQMLSGANLHIVFENGCENAMEIDVEELGDIINEIELINQTASELLNKTHDPITIVFDGLEYLSDDTKLNILSNPLICKNIDNYVFSKLVVSSEKNATKTLKTVELSNRLNQIDKGLYDIKGLDLIPIKQTFPSSCFACSLLMTLNYLGEIKKEEVTRRAELSIYQNIWISPGNTADIDKVLGYLEQYKNIEIIGVNFTDRSNTFLEKIKRGGDNDSKIIDQFKLFNQRESLTKKNFSSENLPEKDFLDEKSLLLMVHHIEDEYTNKNETHVHLGVFNKEENKFTVIDPGNGHVASYDTLTDYYEKEKSFMGIALHVSSLQNK